MSAISIASGLTILVTQTIIRSTLECGSLPFMWNFNSIILTVQNCIFHSSLPCSEMTPSISKRACGNVICVTWISLSMVQALSSTNKVTIKKMAMVSKVICISVLIIFSLPPSIHIHLCLLSLHLPISPSPYLSLYTSDGSLATKQVVFLQRPVLPRKRGDSKKLIFKSKANKNSVKDASKNKKKKKKNKQSAAEKDLEESKVLDDGEKVVKESRNVKENKGSEEETVKETECLWSSATDTHCSVCKNKGILCIRFSWKCPHPYCS
ncbi:unnamed protein product [Oncorhynchus mykiss]|uniref:Uncharacterized protein n=1 Tax=Oncorhynchus mykiss TaxID=8022 RepID=A0A060X2V4_ONCMY|nr:unnamed protein product [Oncorhynchus mykiss]